MNLQVLTEFQVLAETLSFQKAAELLGLSHSTLSKHIQKLELELGKDLFTRTTRSVALNQYGQVYRGYINQILKLHNQAVSEMLQLQDEEKHVLKLVFPPAPERYGLAELLSGFQEVQPGIRIDLLDSDEPQKMLLSGQCHFAIAPQTAIDPPEIGRLLYVHDRLAVVFSEDHPLAKFPAITIEQLRGERFILHRDCIGNIQSQEDLLKELCCNAGFSPDITQTVNFSSTIIRLVGRREGITVMNRLHVPVGISGVCVVDITPEVPFDIYLFYRKDKKLSAVAQAFLDYFHTTR